MSLSVGMKLIAAFVTLIIAVVLVGSIATEGLGKTTLTNVANEEQTFTPIKIALTLNNESQTFSELGNATTLDGLKLILLSNTIVTNATDDTQLVPASNYTVSGATIIALDGWWNNTIVNVTTNYSFWRVNNSATVTTTNAPIDWQATECPLTSFTLKNGSAGTALTITTDYVPTLSTGTYTLVNNSDTIALIDGASGSNSSYANYEYCGDEYMNLGWGRTLINLVPGLFAIAIFMVSVGLFYSVGKDTGII